MPLVGGFPLPAPPRAVQLPPLAAAVLLITDGVTLPDAPDAVAPQAVLSRLATVLAAVPPGSIAVQLRNRQLPGRALYERAIALRQLTARYAAPLLINDRLDVALAVEADGVHLPGHGLPVQTARSLLGPRRFLCAAAHSLPEARMLLQAGADAITLSPIWPTPSKPWRSPRRGDVSPLGLAGLAQAMAELGRACTLPIYALGGIDSLPRVTQCAALGARVACLRALLSEAVDEEGRELTARAAAYVAAAAAATSTGE